VGAILNNRDAEALILDVRTGHQAAATVLDGGGGAFLVFSTTVIIDRPGRGQLVFPLHTTMEPGSLCRQSGRVAVSASVDGVELEGDFAWTVSEQSAGAAMPTARYRFVSDGRPTPPPPWAPQLPRSVRLARRSGAQLLRDRERLVRQGHVAEHWLLVLSQRVMEASCRGPLRRVLATHRLVQDEDVVQRGLQAAGRLLDVYASPQRPPRSWLGMIQLDAKRDMHREVSQLDWLPRELSEVVDRARVAGITLDPDPTVTLAALIDAALDGGQPLPRVSARQVQAALSAPELVPLDAPLGPWHGWQPQDGGTGAPDPALDAIDNQEGEAAAALAGIVMDDEETVARAFLGDPAAVKAVADRVVAALRRPGEALVSTRRRCAGQFRTTGRLLSTEGGTTGFPDTDAGVLLALDAALRAAIGLEVSGPGIERDDGTDHRGGDRDVDD
jgi:hypothetical protein